MNTFYVFKQNKFSSYSKSQSINAFSHAQVIPSTGSEQFSLHTQT